MSQGDHQPVAREPMKPIKPDVLPVVTGPGTSQPPAVQPGATDPVPILKPDDKPLLDPSVILRPDIKQPEKERVLFRPLLLENPNYFGTAIEPDLVAKFQPVLPMSGNTSYEELTCVGLDPGEPLLEAVVEVKLPYGFGGDLCTAGTKEYVAFYADYGDGAGFVSVGAAADVVVHDMASVADQPLYYAVRRAFTPKQSLPCDQPQVIQVRAILSWEAVPSGPNYIPVWGNIMDVWVQIAPSNPGGVIVIPIEKYKQALKPKVKFPPLGPKYAGLAKPIDWAMLNPQPLPPKLAKHYGKLTAINPQPEPPGLYQWFGLIPQGERPRPKEGLNWLNPQPEPPAVFAGDAKAIQELLERSAAAVEMQARSTTIEPARANFEQMVAKNPNYFGSITQSQQPAEIASAVQQLPKATANWLSSAIAVDPGVLVPVMPYLLKTSYEELKCVGLYPESDLLEAVVEIKLPYGFCGDLCTLGGTEYVAFYVDWGTGIFEHVGTDSVTVHDIPGTDARHLSYALRVQIPDGLDRHKACSVENVVTVRAVLSWQVDPTPYGAGFVPAWGNVLTRRVQIMPATGPSAQCSIEIVSEVVVEDIAPLPSASAGLAIKISSGGTTVPGTFDRPFGYIVAAWGTVNVPGASHYRFQYSTDGVTWVPITDPRYVRLDHFGTSGPRYPDPAQGWFSIADYTTDLTFYSHTALVHWYTYGKNGLYLLRLELGAMGMGGTVAGISGQTFDVPLYLDNTGPALYAFNVPAGQLPATGVAVKNAAGNWLKCGKFSGTEEIQIWGNFYDTHFLSYSLTVFGGNITPSGVGIASGRYDAAPMGSMGVPGATDPGPGVKLYSLDLCSIPQALGARIPCAYGVELYLYDRTIVGSVSGYTWGSTDWQAAAFVTFDWDPAGVC